MRRPEHRSGTFSHAYDEMVFIHERMAENGTHFAASLMQMHDDLVDLASNSERSRKNWKANGLAAEQKVADLEASMRKSKAKYDSLAEEYERARTGEGRQTGKVFNAFKNKSAAQQEEDLLKKVQAADQTYHSHVQTLQTEKAHLESSTRPEAIKAIQDLIKELDSGLSLQMQKFGTSYPRNEWLGCLETDMSKRLSTRSCCSAMALVLAQSRVLAGTATLLLAVCVTQSCLLITIETFMNSLQGTSPRFLRRLAKSNMSVIR